MESKKPVLTAKDYLNVTLRSYYLQNGFNYNSYQGTGYLFVIFPALKKIYKNDPEKLKEVSMENIEFYNTNPHMLPFITSMHLAMCDHGEEIEDTRSIKMALMGHLGYKLGTNVIATLSEKIGQISNAANIVGVTVISALAVTFVKAKIGIQYATTLASGEEQIVSIQTILDKILPNMLPAVITIAVFTLVKKYKWSTYKLLALLFVLGIGLSYFGILV